MINIILCDTNLNSIKLVLESISSQKKINLYLIASEFGEICSYSLSYRNSYFLINTDIFPEEKLSDMLLFLKNKPIFYNSSILEENNIFKNLEKILIEEKSENYSQRFYKYFRKHLSSLKFNFSLPRNLLSYRFFRAFLYIFQL